VRNEIETKRNETERNETKSNKTKRNRTKQNETDRNETKRNVTSFRFVSFRFVSIGFVSFHLISFRSVSFRFYFVSHFTCTPFPFGGFVLFDSSWRTVGHFSSGRGVCVVFYSGKTMSYFHTRVLSVADCIFDSYRMTRGRILRRGTRCYLYIRCFPWGWFLKNARKEQPTSDPNEQSDLNR
jgi:hypothetical protein